ncbi:entry exclusion lipoprotein TrbK [Yersinia enterocolitica]|uniref:Entry exclusion lipoprotein TrbK n=3 Tax=Yersiniaceae TaxID=1903411 RepID=A0ABX6FCN2_YERIN|nr:entry exclusion lipoprotein TrbK [Yersinia enterocolitica]QGR67239.1 entry exclusion lipoprotein TrbK [Yersinia intermedia]EKN5072173.1 entry exclusion lipoprotein TrbK [Yersinia enterocolitica]EKN5085683.1 entry exclusion lipoprotein TrbK [Yersinia enterocolitica]EKN5100144.1 entry exclusion lipoprotein TrbK [Yersinia enterocolitica]
MLMPPVPQLLQIGKPSKQRLPFIYAEAHLRKAPLEAGEDNTMIIKIGFAVAVLVLSGCDNSKNNQSCSDVRHMEDSPQRRELASKCLRKGEFKKSPSQSW